MTLDEVVVTVMELTQRPDKRVAIAAHANAVMALMASRADFYDMLTEITVSVDPTLYGQSFLMALLPRFKKFKYIKRTGSKNYIEPIGPDKVLTPLNQIQPNVYYIAGDSCTFTVDSLTPTLEVGYYQYLEPLNAVASTNWMLTKMPYAIIDLTASRLLQAIGDLQGAASYKQTGEELFIRARNDFADGFVPGAR